VKELFEKEESFKNRYDRNRPLAFRMKPQVLDEYAGQSHLLGKDKQLRKIIESGVIFPSVFYGPPGCGKSALSNIIAERIKASVERINAVSSTIKTIRKIAEKARVRLEKGIKTVLIVDEIHRFNKTQQESLLPDVEEGVLILIGLTAENPYYYISGPLISRVRVYKLAPLKEKDIKKILKNAVKDEKKGLGKMDLTVTSGAIDIIAKASEGDARYALNTLEMAAAFTSEGEINSETIKKCIGGKRVVYDRDGSQHYDTISAFIKSMRGSDPDAAAYYLAKMISSGEDPRFIARRIAICASEDIGNADPRALILANSALGAVEYVGMPEAGIILAQAAIYAASAPKSNAACAALNRALSYVEKESFNEIPRHLTKSGSSEYKYPHDFKYGYVSQRYMKKKKKFYKPSQRGYEKIIKKYLDFLNKYDEKEKKT